ncbi:MAG: hypothetical protein ACOX44_13485 [Limnochordia bacterium]|jgi:hypothetical protein
MEREDENLAIKTYGHRIFESQTLPEYLLEFALVFLAEKDINNPDLGGEGKFPTRAVSDAELKYTIEARMGLKRFIFFERSKQEYRLEIDRRAYLQIRKLIEERIDLRNPELTQSDVVDILQELLYGYNAVIRSRSWFVQSLLPICPELIFPEAMRRDVKKGSDTKNSSAIEIQGNVNVDNKFQFHGHYFLARGGEVYYLHVLQGLNKEPEYRPIIEDGLLDLFNARPEVSKLAQWIQHTWDEYMKVNNTKITLTCRWIPSSYAARGTYTCRELASFLSAKIDRLQKIQLLSIGVVLQILRMMHDRAASLTRPHSQEARPVWIIHVPGCRSTAVRGLSERSYQQCEEDLLEALYTQKADGILPEKLRVLISKASKNAHMLFRKLGKSAQLVIPLKGPHMRFSLSEDLLKFLVMALVRPGERILLSEFMSYLYEHFGIIIGPTELDLHQEKVNLNIPAALLRVNEDAFRDMLKACGFLRDLSDATAIVENPFGGEVR